MDMFDDEQVELVTGKAKIKRKRKKSLMIRQMYVEATVFELKKLFLNG
jgi:hypothetical protein